MPTKVFLVHGWSVRSTQTYQALHLQLAQHGFELEDIYLGRYVSLDDHVEMRDIARGLHRALQQTLGDPPWVEPFHVVTHSTGALVVKHWLVRHYVEGASEDRPLKNLVFLAGPHFGSRLAHHGRSMLAHIRYLGDTGERILRALELGSEFSWNDNGALLDPATWRDKGVRPFCLIGDRVIRNAFASKIFPAGYERGSDMVVRVPAGNLNFQRFELNALDGSVRKVGQIDGIPFGALWRYVHSGEDHGIMNSITRSANPEEDAHQNLALVLRCLGVKTDAEYGQVAQELEQATAETRKQPNRWPHAQLDFRFRDQDGQPIEDYRFELGYLDDQDREKATDAVTHTHRNRIDPSHFTVFVDLHQLESSHRFFMRFHASPPRTSLFDYRPSAAFHESWSPDDLTQVLAPDQTTQIDVVLSREPSKNLFVFEPGTREDLHVAWGRRGNIRKTGQEIK